MRHLTLSEKELVRRNGTKIVWQSFRKQVGYQNIISKMPSISQFDHFYKIALGKDTFYVVEFVQPDWETQEHNIMVGFKVG